MQTNGRAIVESALKKIGALAAGETATSEDATDGLARLNSLIDLWKTERLTIALVARTVFEDVVAGTASYTMGDGGDIDIEQDPPTKLEGAATLENDSETPLAVFSDQEWKAITDKALQSAPQGVHYRRAAPLATVDVWPVPDDSAVDLVLYWGSPFSGFADLTTNYDLLPGHKNALEWNLAVELGPEFGRHPDALIIGKADNAKAAIKRPNLIVPKLRVDDALLSRRSGAFDINTGAFRR
jgi:hypothetical protein